MSKKANPTLVGVFIAAALTLGIIGIITFGSASLFSKTREYILYFDSSLDGLNVGAPVKFRGVVVGSVIEVLIHHNQTPNDSALPVVIQINEKLFDDKTDLSMPGNGKERIKNYVKRGLRARLETQSLLTGLLSVNLEFLPETPTRYHQVKPLREEIPTAPNQIQMFMRDFAQITQRLNAVLEKVDASLSELQLAELNRGLTNLIISLNAITSSPELTNTLSSARLALTEVGTLAKDLRPEIQKLAQTADRALASSTNTLNEVRHGVEDIRDVLAPRGALRRDVSTALEELANAARSVAALADFLNEHPNALISGRSATEGKP